ncbi:hypothetical protein NQ314_018181 [Rhamnusium bicolor]|uniref:glutathione transferase n=1 Tax=Rhamnusium bicolor TaxID=1586634 RepID=A0AAV8WSL6_9CUCU|nr:hypothetical protein NQ314_018181 [Rhamnusium bicolor]
MVLIYFFDLMSQPSRALYIFLKLAKIPFEARPVALTEGEHFTEEFKEKYSKFQKVPFIHDGNFRLTERYLENMLEFFRYLIREYPVDDHWYPKDSKHQARVDEYLEWQHLNIRMYCSIYFVTKWLIPTLTGKQPTPEKLKKVEDDMANILDKFEELFLANGPFINGLKISFADILAACEIEQPRMAGYDAKEGRPVLKSWMERVRNECNPYYDEAHEMVNKIAESSLIKLQAKL